MSEPRDLRDLIGEDVPPQELAALREADALLRRVPAPPPSIPDSLTLAVKREANRPASATPLRRAGKLVALAAALAVAAAAGFFGLGSLLDRNDFEPTRTIAMSATRFADGASAKLELGEREADGNWSMELDVSGLRQLADGGYYLLWLEKDGEYAGACGSFNVGADGQAHVRMNASYRLSDYDAFVITAEEPRADHDAPPRPLFEAPTT